jgi:hypothetical protein
VLEQELQELKADIARAKETEEAAPTETLPPTDDL